MAGTGLYSVKVAPTKSDDTQSGAPAGQVITLVTGGLGSASAYAGGYVTNVTRTETRAIVSHTDGTVTLEGNLANWLDTDDLDIYDAWSTIQAAHDQLFTDQSTAVFTIPQIIRVFAGTYTENVVIATTLSPRQNFYLAFEANEADSVTIDGSATYCILNGTNTGVTRFDRLTFTTTGTGAYANASFNNARSWQFRDCVFNSLHSINMGGGRIGSLLVERTRFTGSGWAVRVEGHPFTVVDCVFQTSANGIYCREFGGHVEGCTFGACGSGINGNAQSYNGQPLSVRNCTFYACTTADINMGLSGLTRLVALNNIHKDSTLVYRLPTTSELANVDRNCIHNATEVADLDGVGYTTLADWQAFVGDQGNSPDANSIDTDPLLTDPGAGDFTPASTSPCDGAGIGAGVATDVNGDSYDPYHPTIGGVSLGTWARPQAPSITAVDDGTATSLTATIDADNAGDVVYLHYRKRLPDTEAWSVFGSTRTGDGDLQVTGLTAGKWGIVAIAKRNGEWSLPSNEVLVDVTNGESTSLYPEHALVELLTADATFAGLVGNRVYPTGDVPQEPESPYMVYQRISTPGGHHMAAASNAQEIRIQTTIWAEAKSGARATARAVATAAREALDGFSGMVTLGATGLTITSIRLDDYDDAAEPPTDGSAQGPAAIMQDWIMWHAQTVPSFS